DSAAQWRRAGIGAVWELLVHNRNRRGRFSIVRREGPAFAELRADGGEVVAADVANQRDLAGGLGSRLPVQQVERRIREVGERDEIDRCGADDTGNRANPFHFRVDEGDTLVEVLGIT